MTKKINHYFSYTVYPKSSLALTISLAIMANYHFSELSQVHRLQIKTRSLILLNIYDMFKIELDTNLLYCSLCFKTTPIEFKCIDYSSIILTLTAVGRILKANVLESKSIRAKF